MEDKYGVRSNNTNVFVYSSYWQSWSRVLFHESDQKMAREYGLEKQTWIELDLTPANPHSIVGWRDRVQHANIRCHSTPKSREDKVVWALPHEVVQLMRTYLTEDCVQTLLHGDFLPYIDFDKGRKINNGGFPFAAATKDYISAQRYLAEMQAGPGVFVEDIMADYETTKAHWCKKIDALIPRGGLL